MLLNHSTQTQEFIFSNITSYEQDDTSKFVKQKFSIDNLNLVLTNYTIYKMKEHTFFNQYAIFRKYLAIKFSILSFFFNSDIPCPRYMYMYFVSIQLYQHELDSLIITSLSL